MRRECVPYFGAPLILTEDGVRSTSGLVKAMMRHRLPLDEVSMGRRLMFRFSKIFYSLRYRF